MGIRHTLVIAALLVSCGAVVPSAQADFVTKTYFEGTLAAHATPASGTAYWKTNKVWRPLGNLFAVWFANSSTIQAGYKQSVSANPIVTQGAYGYDWGYCANLENFPVSPVTCQIFNWYA